MLRYAPTAHYITAWLFALTQDSLSRSAAARGVSDIPHELTSFVYSLRWIANTIDWLFTVAEQWGCPSAIDFWIANTSALQFGLISFLLSFSACLTGLRRTCFFLFVKISMPEREIGWARICIFVYPSRWIANTTDYLLQMRLLERTCDFFYFMRTTVLLLIMLQIQCLCCVKVE